MAQSTVKTFRAPGIFDEVPGTDEEEELRLPETEVELTPEGVIQQFDCPTCAYSFPVRIRWERIGAMLHTVAEGGTDTSVTVVCRGCVRAGVEVSKWTMEMAQRHAKHRIFLPPEQLAKWMRMRRTRGRG